MSTLPFLRRTQEAAASGPTPVVRREPDEPAEADPVEGGMEELAKALEMKNYKLAAEIFRAVFEMLESQPHKEAA